MTSETAPDPESWPRTVILEDMTDAEWDTEIAHTPHLAAQAAIWIGNDLAVGGATDLSGDEPDPETVERALRCLVRKYPTGGNQLEAALRDALRMGWRARHLLSAIREEKAA